jgi:SAM-dependent methyltransferase
MSEMPPRDPPSPFVIEWLGRISAAGAGPGRGSGRALDVAMGHGRHTRALVEGGWRVFGIDWDAHALRDAAAAARASGGLVRAWCADLRVFPLPLERFELIVVTRYLQRDLFPALRDALTPGGVIIYETFTTAQRKHNCGPTSPNHLLAPGELRQQFNGFSLLFGEEVTEPDAYARLCARKGRD